MTNLLHALTLSGSRVVQVSLPQSITRVELESVTRWLGALAFPDADGPRNHLEAWQAEHDAAGRAKQRAVELRDEEPPPVPLPSGADLDKSAETIALLHSQGLGTGRIAARLNDLGLRAPSGLSWDGTSVRSMQSRAGRRNRTALAPQRECASCHKPFQASGSGGHRVKRCDDCKHRLPITVRTELHAQKRPEEAT